MRQIIGKGAQNEEVVWIYCPYPVLARGLADILSGEAIVHLGEDPPDFEGLSCVLLCFENEKEVAQKIREVRMRVSGQPILVFGLSSDLPLVRTALRSGARGFVHAGMEPGQIIRALSVAVSGEIVIPRDLLRNLVVDESGVDIDELTPRQREILRLVIEGMTNAQIGRKLYLSESTIKQHLRAAFKTLQVGNRTEAARLLRGKL